MIRFPMIRLINSGSHYPHHDIAFIPPRIPRESFSSHLNYCRNFCSGITGHDINAMALVSCQTTHLIARVQTAFNYLRVFDIMNIPCKDSNLFKYVGLVSTSNAQPSKTQLAYLMDRTIPCNTGMDDSPRKQPNTLGEDLADILLDATNTLEEGTVTPPTADDYPSLERLKEPPPKRGPASPSTAMLFEGIEKLSLEE